MLLGHSWVFGRGFSTNKPMRVCRHCRDEDMVSDSDVDRVRLVAETLNKMDHDLLWEYPLEEGRSWKTPLRFYSYGLVKSRLRYFVFGKREDHLTKFGREVRYYLTLVNRPL